MYIPEAMYYPPEKKEPSKETEPSLEASQEHARSKVQEIYHSVNLNTQSKQAKKFYKHTLSQEEDFPDLVRAHRKQGIDNHMMINPDFAKAYRETLQLETKSEAKQTFAKILEKSPYLGKIQKFFSKTIISLLEYLGINGASTDCSGEVYRDLHEQLTHHHLRVYGELNTKIIHSNDEMAKHSKATINRPASNQPMTIPSSLFLQSKDLEQHEILSDTEQVNRSLAELAILEHKRLPKIDNFEIEGLGTLVPYHVDENVLVAGNINPSSAALGSINPAKTDSLTNIYVLELEGDKAVIRSGKIDTKQRADDFIAVILNLHNIYGKKMRIVSQQLNSFENETKVIKDQHDMIAYVNSQLAGKAEVVHINTPSNGWYHATRWVNSYPIIGKFVKFMFRTFYDINSFKSEKLSKNLNLEGWATYVNWLTEDIGNSIEELPYSLIKAELLEQLNKLDESNFNKKKLQARIKSGIKYLAGLKNGPPLDDKMIVSKKNTEADLKLSQMELKERLTKDLQILKSIKETITLSNILPKQLANDKQNYADDENSAAENNLLSVVKEETKYDEVYGNQSEEFFVEEVLEIQEPLNVSPEQSITFNQLPAESSIFEKVSLMSDILESQLGVKELDRGQEGMAIQMLSDKLGITCAMNCFSGLDRTGIWHAVKLAMLTLEKKMGPEKPLELVMNWEKTTTLMNQLTAHMEEGEHLGQLFPGFFELDQDGNAIRNLTPEGYDRIDFNQYHRLRGRFGEVFPEMTIPEFTKLKENMLAVIEFRNEVLKQLITVGIPLTTISTGVMGLKWSSGIRENLIPLNFLPSHVQNDNGDILPLVKFNKKGEVEQMTKEGSLLLTKYQDLRKH